MKKVDSDDLAAMNLRQSVIDKMNQMPDGYQILKSQMSEDVITSFSIGSESFNVQCNMYQAIKIYHWVSIYKSRYFVHKENLGLEPGEQFFEAIDGALTQRDKLALLESEMPVIEAKRRVEGVRQVSMEAEYEILEVAPFQTMSEFLSFVYGEDRETLNQTNRGKFSNINNADDLDSQWASCEAHWDVFKNIIKTYDAEGKTLDFNLMIFASTMIHSTNKYETVSPKLKEEMYEVFEKKVSNLNDDELKKIQTFSDDFFGDNYFCRLATDRVMSKKFKEIAKNNIDSDVSFSSRFKL